MTRALDKKCPAIFTEVRVLPWSSYVKNDKMTRALGKKCGAVFTEVMVLPWSSYV